MKKTIFGLVAALSVLGTFSMSAAVRYKTPVNYRAEAGVGPVVAASESATTLPKKAQKFIDKIGASVVDCEREFATGDYDVKLDSGIEVDFNKHGKVIEVDAPDNATLGSDLVKEVVPHRLYNNLKDLKVTEGVTSIEETKEGYKLEFIGEMDEALFSRDGDLIAQYFD